MAYHPKTSAIFTVAQTVRDVNYNCFSQHHKSEPYWQLQVCKKICFLYASSGLAHMRIQTSAADGGKAVSHTTATGTQTAETGGKWGRRGRAEAKEHQDRAWIQQVHAKRKAVFKEFRSGREDQWEKIASIAFPGRSWERRSSEPLVHSFCEWHQLTRVCRKQHYRL